MFHVASEPSHRKFTTGIHAAKVVVNPILHGAKQVLGVASVHPRPMPVATSTHEACECVHAHSPQPTIAIDVYRTVVQAAPPELRVGWNNKSVARSARQTLPWSTSIRKGLWRWTFASTIPCAHPPQGIPTSCEAAWRTKSNAKWKNIPPCANPRGGNLAPWDSTHGVEWGRSDLHRLVKQAAGDSRGWLHMHR